MLSVDQLPRDCWRTFDVGVDQFCWSLVPNKGGVEVTEPPALLGLITVVAADEADDVDDSDEDELDRGRMVFLRGAIMSRRLSEVIASRGWVSLAHGRANW